MSTPEIFRWWNERCGVGQSDDSLLLLDYFADRLAAQEDAGVPAAAAGQFRLETVLRELNASPVPEGGRPAELRFAFTQPGPDEGRFDFADDALLSLCALVLCSDGDTASNSVSAGSPESTGNTESTESTEQGVTLRSLGTASHPDRPISLRAFSRRPIGELARWLRAFAAHPERSALGSVLDGESLGRLRIAAREIAAGLDALRHASG